MTAVIEVSRATTAGWAPGAQRLTEWARAALGRRSGEVCALATEGSEGWPRQD